MNLLNKLTIKNLKLNKKRTIVTIIGIILSISLITAVSSIYNSLIKSLISFEIYEKGNYHVAYYDVPKEDLNIFKSNREIEEYNLTSNIGYAKINSKNEYKPYAYIKGFTLNSLDNLTIRLVEGRLPQNSNEILIPTHLKTNGRLELTVGSEITLDIGVRITKDSDRVILKQSNPFQPNNEEIINTISKTYKIVGIIERPSMSIESYSAPGYTFVTLLDNEDNISKVDVFALYKENSIKNIYKLTANILGVDADLFEKYNKGTASFKETELYLHNEKPRYDIDINSYLIDLQTNPLGATSVSSLSIVVAIVIAIIIFTSVFCIKNSFDISITEKIKQYGMLKSIGATKKQIKRNVFYEAFILGLISIPLGILFGLIASYMLIIVSNYFLKDSLAIGLNLKFAFSIIAIIISIILGIITIYLSALKSAKKASKILPIDSIRNSANIKLKSNKIKTPAFVKKLFGIGGNISYKNLKRNKKKYRTTIISITVSVFVFIALSSFMSMAFDTVNNELEISEYNVSLSAKDEASEDKYMETTKLDNISNYTILRQVGFKYQNRNFNPEYLEFLNMKLKPDSSNVQGIDIYALGDEQYRKYINELGLNYDEVKDKGILMDYLKVGKKEADKDKFVYKTLRLTDQKENDILEGNLDGGSSFAIEIGYITNKKPFGLKNKNIVYLVVSDELYDQIKKPSGNYTIEIFYKSNNANQLQDDIDTLLASESYQLNNMEENVRIMENLFTLIGIFLYGFIIVISSIGITNIFNTITTNMELRKQEFAMLKSIGMTSKEFNKMIRLETLFMGMKSLVFGIPIGIALSYIIYYFLAKEQGMPYQLPILAIIVSIIVVFILISLIMRYSMHKINKQNTIETIRNENI